MWYILLYGFLTKINVRLWYKNIYVEQNFIYWNNQILVYFRNRMMILHQYQSLSYGRNVRKNIIT